MGKKKSTQEILAALRAEAKAKQQGGGAAPESPTDGDTGGEDTASPVSEAPAASETPAEPSAAPPKPAASGGKPKSTADILAAARAQAGNKPAAGGGSNGDSPKAPASAAPKPAGGPKSTKDILAAARAQAAGGGGGATAAPAASAGGTATATRPAKAKPAAAPAGEKPSLEEMLKAVRHGAPVEKTAPKPAAPAGPKTPRKPVPAKARAAEPKAETGTRRNFLLAVLISPFALAWIFFSGIMAAWGLALARFMMPNVLVEPPSRFNVGSPGKYAPGTVSEEYKPAFGVWLVNAVVGGQQMIYALSSVCTHLGCTPGWLEGEQKFKCPCHGSGFYITGVNFEGPAPRPLERHAISLLPDGTLEVDKSQKFQQEMGQWDDPASFVPIA